MSTDASSPPTYHSATQPNPVYNTHPPNTNAQRRPQQTGNTQNRADRGGPQVPPLEEREPLLKRIQQIASSTLSLKKALFIFLIVAAFSLCYHLNWRARWDAGSQDRNILQWERLGLYWSAPYTGKCLSYGVRNYRARLVDAASYSDNPIVPCREIPLNIQGVPIKASYCERKGKEIWGHWNVENDPSCTPVFRAWRKHGCVAPGSRRRLASARLDYVTSGEDALQLCASTPIRFKGMYFDRPLSCARSRRRMWGHWEYDDPTC